MQITQEHPSLANLAFLPYVNPNGHVLDHFDGAIGVYAIFSQEKVLVYIGYSRDITLSLKQHLVRQPLLCYWVKACTISKPSRATLEEIRQQWLQEADSATTEFMDSEALWEQPISVQARMNAAERSEYEAPDLDERQKLKVLKQAARRIEQSILTELAARGITETLRFNPKLKENGLLDLK